MKSRVELNHAHVIAGYKTFSNMSDYNREGLAYLHLNGNPFHLILNLPQAADFQFPITTQR